MRGPKKWIVEAITDDGTVFCWSINYPVELMLTALSRGLNVPGMVPAISPNQVSSIRLIVNKQYNSDKDNLDQSSYP